MLLPETRFSALPPGVQVIRGGVTTPSGFRAAGVATGVKKKGRLDLGLLCSELPSVSAALFRISLVTMLVCLLISIRLLPPRPPDVKPTRMLKMYLQWVFAPVFVALLGSTPAVDAQTRLMLGKYMHFYVTSKSRKPTAEK